MTKHPGIGLATLEKIAKQSGAQRVSLQGLKALKRAAEDYAENISKRAIALTNHSKRTTVKAQDILLAAKEQNF